MTLALVTGRANAGKSGVLYGRVEESAAAGESPVVVLPSFADVRRAEREFAARGVLGVRITTLDRWIDELWALHGDGRRVVTSASRAALVSDVIARANLGEYADSARHRGFAELMSDLVQRLTRPVEHSVAGDIALIARSYEEALSHAGLIEPARAALALAGDPPAIGGPICVNRFTDLAPYQEAFIVGMAAANEVMVALTWENGFPATEVVSPVVRRLEAAGAVHTPVATKDDESELGALEALLYRPTGVRAMGGAVRLALAVGDEAEAALAATIVSAEIERGIRPGRIALAFRDAGRRAALLSAALNARGIPAELDIAVAFPQTSFGRALLALLDAASGRDATRERLLAFVLSPYSGVSGEEAMSIDRAWRRRRATGHELVASAAALAGICGRTVTLARTVGGKLVKDVTGDWKELADLMLASSTGASRLAGPEAALDAAGHRAVLSAVRELAEAPESAHADAQAVVRCLTQTSVSAHGAESEDAVQVTEAHRLRSRRFDSVILGGLTAAEFSAEKPEPLVASLLRELGEEPGSDEALAERLLFYLLATRARSRFVMLRQSSDDRGEAVRPSVFWDEVLDLYRDPGSEDPRDIPDETMLDRLELRELALAAPAFEANRTDLRARALEGSAPPVRAPGARTGGELLDGLSAVDEVSVSDIETYLACPYRWFLERAISPRAIDVEVDARERGTRAHQILAEFYRRWPKQSGRARVTADALDEAMALVSQVEGGVEQAARVHANDLAEELSLSRAATWARTTIEADATFLPGFDPLAHELRFGTAHDRPVEVGGIGIRGSVDRVDVGDAGVVITDYKSSRTVSGHASFGRQALVQLPVYSIAVSRLLGKPIAGAVYRSLRSGAARGFWRDGALRGDGLSSKDAVDEAGLARVLEEAESRVAAVADGIRAGRITPAPNRKQACEWCPIKSLCGEAK